MKKHLFVEAFVAVAVVFAAIFGLIALHAQSVGSEPTKLIQMTGGGPGDTMRKNGGARLGYSPGEILHFDVYVPNDGPTNMTFRAYFSEVTQSGSQFVLSSGTAAMSSDWFVTSDTNYFNGNKTYSVTPGETNRFYFQLNATTFSEEMVPDCLIAILTSGTIGVGTNAVGYSGATLYSIEVE